jgi:hypothetical protein
MNVNVLVACWTAVWTAIIITSGNATVSMGQSITAAWLYKKYSGSWAYHLPGLIIFSVIIWILGCITIILIHWLFAKIRR